ncbi:MAG: exosome protein [Candidatus Methanomethylophilus sp.]|nr:exosome protein [Methanomethylophilus sp.]
MQATFHWLRIETFCYATEKEDLVSQTFRDLVGTDEFQTDVSEGEHGNQMLIMQHMVTKQKEMDEIFARLGKELLQDLMDDLENRIDEDCVFYTRLDKQKAVCGEYRVAHHGDVISITGKVASNPARKEVAMENMSQFLKKLIDRE